MSDTVLAGVLGALLSKAGGVPASGGRETGLGAEGENVEGAANVFGAFFDGAGAATSEQRTPIFETGLILKRPPKAALAQVVSADDAPLPSSQPSFAPATIETADLGQNSLFGGSRLPKENFKGLYVVRTEGAPKSNPVHPLVTNVSDLPTPVNGRVFEAAYANFQKGQHKFSTVKLTRQPVETADPTLKTSDPTIKTIKEGAPFQPVGAVTDEAAIFSPPSIDTRKFELSPDYSISALRHSVRAFTPFDVALQLRESYLTLTPEIETPLETQPPKVDIPLSLRFAEAPIAAHFQAPAQDAFRNAFGNLAAPVPDGTGPILTSDVDITFDPALAPASTSTAANGGPTLAASVSAPSPVALAGVLPQIQAAVSTRHGRETVEVRLDPPDLGRVRIDFNVDNSDTIKAVLSAERSETMDFLRRNIVDLENQLKQAGFASISFEFSDAQRQFGAEDNKSLEFETAQLDGAAPLDLRQKIYLSPREFARLDLLL